MSLFAELKRRNVFRVGIAYAVVAWLLLQVADVIINNMGAPDWLFGGILLVLGLGLPVVLIFAWAFEMTPEGLKREHEVDRSQSITGNTGRKLDRVIIVVLALALGYFVVDKFFLTPREAAQPQAKVAAGMAHGEAAPGAAEQHSIAVLPLANRSAREEDQFFTDGIHDDLLTQLAKISSLKVISRTSVMRYRNTELSIPEIAQQLGVQTILEGGIQRSGEQIRINVQLIDAATDEHLWAETYDRRMTAENLFAIQSEITRAITAALQATLTDDEAARIDERLTDNLEAVEEQMKGQQLLALRTVPGMEEAKQHFERAIAMDPGFAEAQVGLANAYHLLYEYAGWDEEASLDPAMTLLEQALAISPNLGEAYMVRGEIHRHRHEFDLAEADFQRAIKLIPGNATMWLWYSLLRSDRDDTDVEYKLLARAHELDPMSRVVHLNYAMVPFNRGDDEAALAELARIKELHPDYPTAYTYESLIHWSEGDPVGSLRAQLKVHELDPKSTRAGWDCLSYLDLGARESALDCIARDRSPNVMGRLFIRIESYLIEDKRDLALAVLDSAQDVDDDPGLKAWAALSAGNFAMARPWYEQQHPEWFDVATPVTVNQNTYDRAIDAAVLLREANDDARARQLLEAALDVMAHGTRNRGSHAYGFSDVSALALLGRREEALAALETCADLGYLSGWQQLKYLPHFDALRGDPRFDSALARLGAAAEEARKRAQGEGLL